MQISTIARRRELPPARNQGTGGDDGFSLLRTACWPPWIRSCTNLACLIATLTVVAWLVPGTALAWTSGYANIADGNTGGNSCLDLQAGSSANGTPIQQWTCNGQPWQNWALQSTSQAGYYEVVNQYTGKCMDVVGGSPNDGAPIQEWDCLGNPQQLWQPVWQQSTGWFQLTNAILTSPQECLDVPNGSANDGVGCSSGPVTATASKTGTAQLLPLLTDKADHAAARTRPELPRMLRTPPPRGRQSVPGLSRQHHRAGTPATRRASQTKRYG